MARTANMSAYRLLLVELMRGGKEGYEKEPIITVSQCKRLNVNYRVGSYSFKALMKYGVFHKEHGTGRIYLRVPRDFSLGNEGTPEAIYSIAKEMYYKEHPYTPKEKAPKKESFSINEDGSISFPEREKTLKEASLDEIFDEIKSRGYIMYITKA